MEKSRIAIPFIETIIARSASEWNLDMRRLVSFALLAACSAITFGQAPPANELLKQAAQADKEQEALRTQYYFRKRSETYVLDDKGKPGKLVYSEDSETVFLAGRNVP